MPSAEVVIKSVGRRVAELRVERGRTQAEVAEALDFTVKYQQLVESGSENLTLRTLVKFASYFRVEPAELLRPSTSSPTRRGRPRRRQP